MALPPPRPGSVALITGASSGIGSELARQLCGRGHDVVLVARRRELLELLAEDLRNRYGRTVTVVACDLSEPVERARLASEVEDLAIQVDLLILCAGIGFGGWFVDLTLTQIALMARVNFEATLDLTQRYVPAMAERGAGAVLFVSSVAAGQPMPFYGVYAATKAAVTSFAESLRAELAADGVTVTTLTPGLVATDFIDSADFTDLAKRVPRPLMITPEECARAGIDGLSRGRRRVMPQVAVRISHYLSSHLQRDLWLIVSVRLMAKMKARRTRVHP